MSQKLNKSIVSIMVMSMYLLMVVLPLSTVAGEFFSLHIYCIEIIFITGYKLIWITSSIRAMHHDKLIGRFLLVT